MGHLQYTRICMRSYQVDMCNGPIFKKLIIFSLPLILSGCLQLLFNAADIIVVGRFTGNQALAAVGSTSALINLLVNMFIGISVGANVVLGKFIGARDEENTSKAVHTAIFIAIFGGLLMVFVGNVIKLRNGIFEGNTKNVLLFFCRKFEFFC